MQEGIVGVTAKDGRNMECLRRQMRSLESVEADKLGSSNEELLELSQERQGAVVTQWKRRAKLGVGRQTLPQQLPSLEEEKKLR